MKERRGKARGESGKGGKVGNRDRHEQEKREDLHKWNENRGEGWREVNK